MERDQTEVCSFWRKCALARRYLNYRRVNRLRPITTPQLSGAGRHGSGDSEVSERGFGQAMIDVFENAAADTTGNEDEGESES